MKIGLVLEGGAMRGMFTAGVLDIFLDEGILIDGIIGVSAGALFGVNYLSKQRGRTIRYNKRFCKDLRYMSILSLLFTGNIVNKNFAYYKVSKKLDVFDDETFKKSKKDFFATVTNIKTGKPEYIKINSCYEDMEILRATSAMPLVTKPVKINDNLYLDGAIGDSIPINKMKELGYDKIIVVLTRPLNYRKDNLSEKTILKVKKKFKKYPNLVESMIERPKIYNDTLNELLEMEKNGEVFVIRPSKNINVKVIERRKEKLQEVYDLGIYDAKKNIKKLRKYLEK